MQTDRIEKKIVLRAPLPRVWKALTDPQEFGTWFGMKMNGAFTRGKVVTGRVIQPGYEHIVAEFAVERMEPPAFLSYRWHPYPADPAIDYSKEPTTLVEFRLEEIAGGTQLTVVESGFDKLPEARRAEAFRMNDGGWTQQMKNIEKHVGQ